jgi:hypothetical protein
LEVLYEGLGNSKLQFLKKKYYIFFSCTFFLIVGHQNSRSGLVQPEMLDPESMNPDPKHCQLGVRKIRRGKGKGMNREKGRGAICQSKGSYLSLVLFGRGSRGNWRGGVRKSKRGWASIPPVSKLGRKYHHH